MWANTLCYVSIWQIGCFIKIRCSSKCTDDNGPSYIDTDRTDEYIEVTFKNVTKQSPRQVYASMFEPMDDRYAVKDIVYKKQHQNLVNSLRYWIVK